MIGSGTLTKQIAGYLARTGFDALDDDALRATKEHILYTLGTILAGSSAPGIKQALAGARALSGASQESTVLVTGDKLPAAFAALVNATMGHSRELDINDDRIAYKSSITVIPAALAVAEKVGKVSGKDFITAVCLGVDLGIRLGLATNPKPVHARAIALGPFAAAAACGKILGFDESGLHNALGIAFCRSTVCREQHGGAIVDQKIGRRFRVAERRYRRSACGGRLSRGRRSFSRPGGFLPNVSISRKATMPSCSINSAAGLKSFWLDRSPFRLAATLIAPSPVV